MINRKGFFETEANTPVFRYRKSTEASVNKSVNLYGQVTRGHPWKLFGKLYFRKTRRTCRKINLCATNVRELHGFCLSVSLDGDRWSRVVLKISKQWRLVFYNFSAYGSLWMSAECSDSSFASLWCLLWSFF